MIIYFVIKCQINQNKTKKDKNQKKRKENCFLKKLHFQGRRHCFNRQMIVLDYY